MLWVRWFEYDTSYGAGWQAKRLHRIQFIDALDPEAFGLVHPRDVIRAIHLIPAFHHMGHHNGLPENSIGRQYESPSYAGPRELESDDWKYYYVNMFVESDIFMLFRGGGIGHQELHGLLKDFATDAGLDKLILPTYDSEGNEVEAVVEESEDEHEEVEEYRPGGGQADDESERSASEDEDLGSEEEWFEKMGPEDGDDGFVEE
ncbi:hypothetical protein D9758_016235 [Tetrapyrgos nigripes]|uniref:Uncharacterized protein n=1 Tax=Tetrapyrgos nigripes TaxID=182062 RepID=A0A8H5FG25_9AGAR|nr:hypothetical protein D9758_016235 [Tetrapyrgos nigripes]